MIFGHFGGTPTFHHHFGGEWSRWNLPRVSVYVSHLFPRPCVFVGLALGFQTPNVRRYDWTPKNIPSKHLTSPQFRYSPGRRLAVVFVGWFGLGVRVPVRILRDSPRGGNLGFGFNQSPQALCQPSSNWKSCNGKSPRRVDLEKTP